MNHHEGYDVFTKNYSRTTNNIALVNYRLGEIRGHKEAEPGEALERDRKLHLFKSVAVEFLVRFQGIDIKAMRSEKKVSRIAEVAVRAYYLFQNMS